jgi:hypothetical protein
MLIFALLLGCGGCVSCQPSIPLDDNSDTDQDQNTGDDSAASDSGGDTATDTGPPPPCPVMELEPNGSYDASQPVPMEQWVCGAFEAQEDVAADLDVYSFTFPEEGWLKGWVRGQGVGSSADLMLTFKVGSETGLSTFHLESTDPLLVVPVGGQESVYAAVQEQFNNYGENQFYEALFSQVKAPVEYNAVEDESEEDNNGMSRGTPVEDGDRIMGVINSNFDRDWFVLELPEGKSTIELNFDANTFGSPVDLIVYLYPPETLDDPETSYVKVRNTGSNANSYDPKLTYTVQEGGTWGILVKSFTDTGSDLYWYVMDVSVEEEGSE